MQELARKKARESLGSLNPEEVAYLLLDLEVDPAIAYAFEDARVSAQRTRVRWPTSAVSYLVDSWGRVGAIRTYI